MGHGDDVCVQKPDRMAGAIGDYFCVPLLDDASRRHGPVFAQRQARMVSLAECVFLRSFSAGCSECFFACVGVDCRTSGFDSSHCACFSFAHKQFHVKLAKILALSNNFRVPAYKPSPKVSPAI